MIVSVLEMIDNTMQHQGTPPQISIIINCFDGEEFLRESLDSALSQSFLDWELIFWDNKSRDNSANIFSKYADFRFKYFLSNEFTSLGDARNLAVSKASGKWLAFMDCDDVWPANKLALQMAAIEEATDRNIGFVYGLFKIKFEGTTITDKSSTADYYSKINITPHGPVDLFSRLVFENFIIFSSVLILTSLYRDVGGIDSRLCQNEDYDLLLKASQRSLAICVNATCVTYRIHLRSNSQTQSALSYDEFDYIYSALPDSPTKYAAIRRNKSRFAIYKIRNGEFYNGVLMLLKTGSVLWIVLRLHHRFTLVLKKLLNS
jgi:glycosyltransferase involved in cell wall biosynthesis